MSDPTLGEVAIGVSIAVSVFASIAPIGVACDTQKPKYLWWLLLTTTMWLWFPFVIYGMYYVGSASIGAVDRLNRNDKVIPAVPKVVDMNDKQPTPKQVEAPPK